MHSRRGPGSEGWCAAVIILGNVVIAQGFQLTAATNQTALASNISAARTSAPNRTALAVAAPLAGPERLYFLPSFKISSQNC